MLQNLLGRSPFSHLRKELIHEESHVKHVPELFLDRSLVGLNVQPHLYVLHCFHRFFLPFPLGKSSIEGTALEPLCRPRLGFRQNHPKTISPLSPDSSQ